MTPPFYPVKNGQISFGGISVLQHSFPLEKKATSTQNRQQGYLAQDVLADSGAKQYATVADFPHFIDQLVIKNQKDFHLYELIPPDKPVRPYFDVEWDASQLDEKETLLYALGAIAVCLLRVGFTPDNGISVFTASGAVSTRTVSSGRKASYHIICSTREVFRSVADHKIFVQSLLIPHLRRSTESRSRAYWTTTDGSPMCIFDAHPYSANQNFRLPYQSKWTSGATRRLVPYDLTEMDVTDAGLYMIGVYGDYVALELPEEIRGRGPSRPLGPLQPLGIQATLATPSDRMPVDPHDTPLEHPQFAAAVALCDVLTDSRIHDCGSCRDLIWCLWGMEQTPRMSEFIHRVCARSPKYYDDVEWANRLMARQRHATLQFSSLVFWAKQDAGESAVKAIIRRHRVTTDADRDGNELFECRMRPARHTEIDVRYLGQSDVMTSSTLLQRAATQETDTLIIQSHLGTGKTQWIKDHVLTVGGYTRVLIVSPRKSYTHAQQGALPHFTSYLEVFGDLASVDLLILQVESLHRINSAFQAYDLVLLDEVESILNQLHSVQTNAGNLITNHEVLERAVGSARHVIMADAFVSDRTFHFSQSLRNRERTHSIANLCQPYCRQAVFLKGIETTPCVANLGAFCERVCEALRSGRRIVIIWTSKRKGEWFAKQFLSEYTHLFYHSTTEKDVLLGLRDVSATWRNIQCLMMTTSITVGLSYDPPVTPVGGMKRVGQQWISQIAQADARFDEAFLYGSAASASPRDIAQALFRVRSLKAERLTYVVDVRGAFCSGAVGLDAVRREMMAKESALIRHHPLVNWTTCPAWAQYNFIYCENEARRSRVSYRAVLDTYLTRSGYAIVEETHLPAEALAATVTAAVNTEALMWEHIADVEEDRKMAIWQAMKRGEASTSEILQYKKAVFRAQWVTDTTEDDMCRWWNVFYPSGDERRFWNVVQEKRWRVEDVARAEASRRYAMMTGDAVKERETLARFLRVMGMTHSQEPMAVSVGRLEELGAALAPLEKKLRKGLGLRVSERKGEWKVKNTMDLIEIILDKWGGSKVERTPHKRRRDGEVIREYSLGINQEDTFWDNIFVSDVELETFSFKL